MHVTIFIFAGLFIQCVVSASVGGATGNDEQQQKFLQHIDELIQRDTLNDYKEAERLLRERRSENGDSSPLLWRLASCFFFYKTLSEDQPKREKRALIEKGLRYAKKALRLNDTDPEAHKWFAILTGERGKSMGLSDKARAGITFKKHLDRAVQLRPEDPSIHHLIGIFEYEVGKLSWLEKTMATAMFDDFPNASVDDAIKSFLLANRYSKKPWMMNIIYLVKCYIHENKFSDAKLWLDVAKEIRVKNREDKLAAEEIVTLRKQLT